MPKVQVDLPGEVHGAVRVEAAVRGLSIAAMVAVLCREAVMGPLVGGAPPVVGVVLEDRPVVERRRPVVELRSARSVSASSSQAWSIWPCPAW